MKQQGCWNLHDRQGRTVYIRTKMWRSSKRSSSSQSKASMRQAFAISSRCAGKLFCFKIRSNKLETKAKDNNTEPDSPRLNKSGDWRCVLDFCEISVVTSLDYLTNYVR